MATALHRTQPLTVEQHLALLTPRAARSYLRAYARAGLPVPLTEYQLAIVRARAAADEDGEPAQQDASPAEHGPLHLTVA